MDDELDRQTAIIRKHQAHCKHPSWVCSCCHLFKDNIRDEQRLRIAKLEALLTLNNISFIDTETVVLGGIIELPVKIEIPVTDEDSEHFTS